MTDEELEDLRIFTGAATSAKGLVWACRQSDNEDLVRDLRKEALMAEDILASPTMDDDKILGAILGTPNVQSALSEVYKSHRPQYYTCPCSISDGLFQWCSCRLSCCNPLSCAGVMAPMVKVIKSYPVQVSWHQW